MTAAVPVSPDWLALREPEDARSRSRRLARSARSLLDAPPHTVHDLGSGTGSMARWLAPLLPGPQTWILHDWNAGLLARAQERPPADSDGRPVRLRRSVEPLDELGPARLAGASLITASALLDVLTQREVSTLVTACLASRAPTLLCLSVTGRVGLDPADPRDQDFQTAFNDHQQRDADGRRLLGPRAGGVAHRFFAAAGWRVRSAGVSWQPRGELLREWLEGWLWAAVEQNPRLGDQTDYLESRRRQAAAGRLHAVVHQLDLLAWPS